MTKAMHKWMFCVIAAVLAGCGGGGSGGGAANSTYTVGGTVSGLSSGASVVLLDNGGDALTVAANGAFAFKTAVAGKAAYAVTVGTQPTGETCTVSGGSGTVASVNVTNIAVTCTATSTSTYSIGGTVSGLSSGASVVLLDNGGDALTVAANGAFTFKTALASKAAYAVTVGTQPTAEACTVSGGSGTVASANVTDVVVACTATSISTYSIGGTVSGLSSGASLVLLDNGGDALTVTANGAFTFKTALGSGAAYAVTVGTQPTAESCTVSGGSGTVASANVTNVAVTCTGAAATLTTLFIFDGLNGGGPTAPLVQGSDGNFYGTTENGAGNLSGTVFKITPAGVLLGEYVFPGAASSGAKPTAGLIQGSNGNFFGTTSPVLLSNQQQAFATVFEITPSLTLTTLYTSTTPPTEGPETASASLLQGSGGNFYGTTQSGGANGAGSVFMMTPGGTLTTLYSFGSALGDGNQPLAGLVTGADGDFYGSTTNTIFKITPNGTLTTLYSFPNVSGNSAYGISALVLASDGNFYGTTQAGGANSEGMIFQVTSAGAFTQLYSFSNLSASNFGTNTVAGLIQANDGNLYGTTQYGGANGEGSVYRITTTGDFTTLYSFGAVSITDVNTDGAQPTAGVVQGSDGALYGTTYVGGTSGAGTVFKLSAGLAAQSAGIDVRRQK